MSARVEISGEYIMEAARQPAVIKALSDTAKKVARRAESLAAAEDVNANVWTEDTVRPKGRPVSNVYMDNGEQEFGTARMPRHRILGRAAEGA